MISFSRFPWRSNSDTGSRTAAASVNESALHALPRRVRVDELFSGDALRPFLMRFDRDDLIADGVRAFIIYVACGHTDMRVGSAGRR
jgi:hypothetical protein